MPEYPILVVILGLCISQNVPLALTDLIAAPLRMVILFWLFCCLSVSRAAFQL